MSVFSQIKSIVKYDLVKTAGVYATDYNKNVIDVGHLLGENGGYFGRDPRLGDNGEVLVDPGIHNGYDTAAIAAGLTGLAGLLAAAPAAIISKKSWPAMALAAGGTGTMLAGAGLNRIAHKNRQYQGNHQPMDEALSGFHGLSNYRSAP